MKANLHLMISLSDAGLPDFLGSTLQNGEKYNQMVIKYTKQL
jgi:hypothetical protein